MTVANARALSSVYCITEHLHRDLACAREVVQGRFHVAGKTLVAGGVPRWRNTAIDADRERWIEWSKFYYGRDLGFAFAQTGDRRFATTWERLVRSWIEQVPSEFGPTDALGRRLQNWIYAYDLFVDAPRFDGFSTGFDELLAARIASDADYLEQHLTPERNHRTLELYALFIAALALPPANRAQRRATFAWEALQENLRTDFRSDGVHREHSTHYHMVVLRSFIGARENARRAGLTIPEAFDRGIRRAFEFALHCHRPDGSTPAMSDGDTGNYTRLLEQAADLLVLDDVLYVATNGAHGTPPADTCADFAEAGYFVQRSAWSGVTNQAPGHRHLMFDCGPLGDGGHGHYDGLSVVAWCGRDLLVDPGRYTYDATTEWRHWFKGTAAHNTVCVDGRDQTSFRPGKPKERPTATLLTRHSAPLLEIVGGEVTSPEYDAVHRRHVFFIAAEYWIVVDDLEGRTPHTYDLRFHLAPDATDATRLEESSVVAPGVTLLFHGPGALRLESGWVAPDYGVKRAAPVVTKLVTACVSTQFVTAIVPTPEGLCHQARPHLAVTCNGNGSIEASLDGMGRERSCIDVLTWRVNDAGRCSASVSRRAR